MAVVGPTASGKTALGISLAKKFGGEVVSFDSRQVYQGMDIGTGKEIKSQSASWRIKVKNQKKEKFVVGYYLISGVRVWLYDVVSPDYRFNAADYYRVALPVIKDIWRRGKLPILVGGTGFYLKVLLEGAPALGTPPDWELREKLEKETLQSLQDQLKKIAPLRWQKMNSSDRANPRRLIRALELVLKNKGKEESSGNFSGIKNEFNLEKKGAILKIGLKVPPFFLKERINRRVEERLKEGLLEEIGELLEKGFSFDNSSLGETLAYREWQEWFEGEDHSEKKKQEIIKKWQRDEYRYARRQMTWFKKDKEITWFDITDKNYQKKVEKLVEVWYDK